MAYNLVIINLDTTRSRTLLNTSSKLAVTNKMCSYITRLGLDDNSIITLQRDSNSYTMFYHPVVKAYYVLRLKKIIA